MRTHLDDCLKCRKLHEIHKAPVLLSQGDIVKLKQERYIVARIAHSTFSLISLSDGNRYTDEAMSDLVSLTAYAKAKGFKR